MTTKKLFEILDSETIKAARPTTRAEFIAYMMFWNIQAVTRLNDADYLIIYKNGDAERIKMDKTKRDKMSLEVKFHNDGQIYFGPRPE